MSKHIRLGLIAAGLIGIGAAAHAAPQPASGDTTAARARFHTDEQRCESGASWESRSTCMKEARAALQASERGKLVHGAPDYAANRLARCDPLQGIDRAACVARMEGAGRTEGSIAGGGILRELTVHYVTDPATGQPVAMEIPLPRQ